MTHPVTIRTEQVPTTEATRQTAYGPDRNWQAQVAITSWPNGEGVDVRVQLGPHSSGSLNLTWEELDLLELAITHHRNEE